MQTGITVVTGISHSLDLYHYILKMEIEWYTSRRVSSGPRKGMFKFVFYKLADGRNTDGGGGGGGIKPIKISRARLSGRGPET